jgi:hypothetical protein
MAQEKQPTAQDIEKMKKALVGAGILKATELSKEDEAKLHAEFAKHGVDAHQNPLMLICHSNHWCLVVPPK